MSAPAGSSPLGEDEVRRIAALARLRITGEEAARFAAQFAGIVGHLDRLREVDTAGVEPLDHPLPLTDVLREDVPRAGISRYEALCRAPGATAGSVRVPRTLPDADG